MCILRCLLGMGIHVFDSCQYYQNQSTCSGVTRVKPMCWFLHTPSSDSRPSSVSNNCLVLCSLVPGFSTASYLKVHIKTHHGSPLPPTATMHTFPEPRGELQMHNGNPYHMGRQCSVEGKQPSAPSPTFMFLAFYLLCCIFEERAAAAAASLCVCMKHEHTSTSAAKLCAQTSLRFHVLIVCLRSNGVCH